MLGGLGILKRYLLAGTSAIGMFAGGANWANAADADQLEAAIKAMQAQMQAQQAAMQAQIAALQKQVEEAKAEAAAAKTASGKVASAKADPPKADPPKPADGPDLNIKWKGGAPELASKDGKFSFKVRGRVQTDYENANQDTAITGFPDLSATELRRARLGVEGIAWWDFKYVFEVDFANDDTRVKDAYLQYQGLKLSDTPILFRVGNFKTPNSFEQMTSDLFVDTVERAAFINAWQLDRQIGFMTAYWTQHFGLAAGIFGDNSGLASGSVANAPLFPGFIGNEGTTFAARGTVAPINNVVGNDSHVLHFGASVRTRDGGDNQPFIQYQARGADLHMTNFALNTGRIGNEDTFWGLEAAALWGPFSVQGEYGNLGVDLPNGAFIRSNPPPKGLLATAPNPFVDEPNPNFNGWYVEASWFFGGRQTYEKEGKWGRPKIANPVTWSKGGGWGGLQIVGKYDVLDQSDSAFNNAGGCPTTRLFPGLSPGAAGAPPTVVAPSVAECGEMKTWLIGVNWYLNDYVRLMFDYAQSDLSDFPVTTITATNTTVPPGTKIAGFDGATIRGFGMRAQIDW
jgi:phosphate-selective porin OprO/OprP